MSKEMVYRPDVVVLARISIELSVSGQLRQAEEIQAISEQVHGAEAVEAASARVGAERIISPDPEATVWRTTRHDRAPDPDSLRKVARGSVVIVPPKHRRHRRR